MADRQVRCRDLTTLPDTSGVATIMAAGWHIQWFRFTIPKMHPGGYDWQLGLVTTELDWSALVNHIGINPIPGVPNIDTFRDWSRTVHQATPISFLLPTYTMLHRWKWRNFCVRYFSIKIVLLLRSHLAKTHHHYLCDGGVQMQKKRNNLIFCWDTWWNKIHNTAMVITWILIGNGLIK